MRGELRWGGVGWVATVLDGTGWVDQRGRNYPSPGNETGNGEGEDGPEGEGISN